jgi:hypothetical protein
MAVERDQTERRVYNLPAELVARIHAFQKANGIASETEAARRLLDSALQMRDQVRDILKAVQARMQTEKDIRVIAAEIITPHVLVKSVSFSDHILEFQLKDGTAGKIYSWGDFEVYEENIFDDKWEWSAWPPAPPAPKTTTAKKEDQKKLPAPDDDIPF